MFANTRAFSGFAVGDLQAARKFYGDVLGINTSERNGLLTLHLAGGRDTLVYPKPGHVPAGYTIPGAPAITLGAGFLNCTATGATVTTTVTVTLAGSSCVLPSNTPSLLTILAVLAPLSLVSIGGASSVYAPLQHQTVEVLKWLTPQEFLELFAIQDALEQGDGRFDARVAQRDCLAQSCHGQCIR